jgi:hypothetical protein
LIVAIKEIPRRPLLRAVFTSEEDSRARHLVWSSDVIVSFGEELMDHVIRPALTAGLLQDAVPPEVLVEWVYRLLLSFLTLPSNWMPYGIAASLLVAFSALMLNIIQLDKPDSGYVSTDQSFDRMQSEYVQIRNPMVQKFWEVNKDLDESVLNDLYRNLDILEQARRDIEAQVRENPENRRLVEMLMSIHEQELDLLKQDYSQPGRSM